MKIIYLLTFPVYNLFRKLLNTSSTLKISFPIVRYMFMTPWPCFFVQTAPANRSPDGPGAEAGGRVPVRELPAHHQQ